MWPVDPKEEEGSAGSAQHPVSEGRDPAALCSVVPGSVHQLSRYCSVCSGPLCNLVDRQELKRNCFGFTVWVTWGPECLWQMFRLELTSVYTPCFPCPWEADKHDPPELPCWPKMTRSEPSSCRVRVRRVRSAHR